MNNLIISPLDNSNINISKEQTVETAKNKVISPRRASPLGEVLDEYKDKPRIPLIIPGITEASFGFVFGPPKCGKTIYCECLSLSIAAGRNTFNGYPLICSNKKCLFVSYEENAPARAERNRRQMENFTTEEQQAIRANYIVSNQEMPRYVLGPKEWQALEEEIIFHKPGIVTIDSLTHMTMGNNSEEDVAKEIARKLRELVDKHGCTIIVINHTIKDRNERAYGVFSMSGSRIYMQEADFIIGINKTIENSRYIKIVASRHDNDDYDTVDTFAIDSNLCIKMIGKENEATLLASYDGRHDSTNRDIVYDAIVKLVETSGINKFSTAQIKHLYENGPMTRPTFYASLNELSESGKIKKVGKGKYEYITS